MILFCPYCRNEPTVDDGDRPPTVFSISCCGVTVDCPTSALTERRWNEMVRSVRERRLRQLMTRARRKQVEEVQRG